ncbi:hypothetical protein GYMLUDRAFT_41308 [Collybiopsis luxurians FD-317 M1]|uniref:Uncharacterized protein n=1 Tax=Collybiopsis luxurians FD-317 M1 TaxID=944289 RepID=A0A0D0D1K3_9AGAR|nr:hypothetical protein GYMLUDRAFT_41308 [Collybiopsis luxurians FD-317 M1]
MESYSESKSELTEDEIEELNISGASAAFTNARNFTMYHPSFVIHHGNSQNTTYYHKEPKLSRGINKRKNLKFNFNMISKCHINLGKVICIRKGSRFFAATQTYGSESLIASNVVIQEFEGSTGKQLKCILPP